MTISKNPPTRPFSRLKTWIWLWTPLMMLSVMPILADWLKNRYEVTLQDLALPIILSLVVSTLVAWFFIRSYYQDKVAAFTGAIIAIIFLSNSFETRLDNLYNFLQVLNPYSNITLKYEGVFFSIILILIILFTARWLGQKISSYIKARTWSQKDLIIGLNIAIFSTFLLQFVPVMQVIITEWPQFFYKPAPVAFKAQVQTAKPDIYYIVLDRYTNQEVLNEQFNFPNTDFLSYLKDSQYYVDPGAYSNYPYTTMSISSTLSANYNTDLVQKFSSANSQILEPYHNTIRYAPVIQQLKDLGYSYYHLGTWYGASNKAPLADHYYQPDGQLVILGHTFNLNSFAKNELFQSPFWQFTLHGIKIGSFQLITYSSQDETNATLSKLDILNDISEAPAGGRFIFAHILTPHEPYLFNADGSLSMSTGTDNNNLLIKQKYLNQVEFIDSQMKTILSQIQQKSQGQAIVVLQSDEGPYPMQLADDDFDSIQVGEELSAGDMTIWSDQSLRMKYGILAAYHIPKANPDGLTNGANSVNVFRLIFNSYFQTQLPYLPECYYAYKDGRGKSFVYTNITQQLTGKSNPACSTNSKF